MADREYIVPGGGIVNDTKTDSEVIIPGFGIYNERRPPPPAVCTFAAEHIEYNFVAESCDYRGD